MRCFQYFCYKIYDFDVGLEFNGLCTLAEPPCIYIDQKTALRHSQSPDSHIMVTKNQEESSMQAPNSDIINLYYPN